MAKKTSHTITIDGYLTQKKLASALGAIVGDDWLGNELKLPNSRRRWDMAFCTEGHTTIIEYDGDAHYRDPLIDQDFPHGFITTKLFPASYCEMGVPRFRSELQSLPTSVSDAVIDSLRERAEEHGIEYVLPSALRNLV